MAHEFARGESNVNQPDGPDGRAGETVDAKILRLGGDLRGAVSLSDLRSAGLTLANIRSRRGVLLTPVLPGLFIVGIATREAQTTAALRCVRHAVLSHDSAAQLHGLPDRAPTSITVSSVYRTRSSVDGVRFRRTRWMPTEDRALVDGRPVTSVSRTICDLAAERSNVRLRRLIEWAIASKRTSAAEFQACVLSYRRQGRTGSRLLRVVGDELFADSVVAASELERQTVELLRSHAIYGWQAQFRPPWFDGVRGTIDFAWPEQKVLLEVDGRRWHTVTQAFEDDRRRDQAAIAAGWRPIRAGWQQVVHRPAELAGVLRTTLSA